MIIEIQKTTQDKIKALLETINQSSNRVDTYLQRIKEESAQTYHWFWNNPDADLTPQAICDELGTNAKLLFQEHSALEDWIASRDSEYVKFTIPEGKSVTFNQDGTVTIETLPIEE